MLRLLFCLLLSAPLWAVPPGRLEDADGPAHLPPARVLYLGENHDSELDHAVQLHVLEQLGSDVTVVAEMFQLHSERLLEDYVARRVDEEALERGWEWISWELYRPLWQLCRERGLPLRPLRNNNASSKLLGKLGVEGFSPEERVGLRPPPYEFGPHPERLRAIFEGHAGPVSRSAFERFVKVQTLWEEFMAAQIHKALLEQPGTVVVLVGRGHLLYGTGLPRRVGVENQKVLLVDPKPEERQRADLWWSSTAAD